MVLNTCETAGMGDDDGTGAKSDAGGASRDRVGPDGHANQSDALSRHRDVPDIHNDMNTAADAMEIISTHQMSCKRKTYLSMQGNVTRSSPEAAWTRRTCA